MNTRYGSVLVGTNGSWPELIACLEQIRQLYPHAAHYTCSLPVEEKPPGEPWDNVPTIWMWNAARQWNRLSRHVADENAPVIFLWLRHGTNPEMLNGFPIAGVLHGAELTICERPAGLFIHGTLARLRQLPAPAAGGAPFDEHVGNSHLHLNLQQRATTAAISFQDLTSPECQPIHFARRDNPLVSACMMVKNGGAFLAQSLESVAGLADEIALVLDASTTDDTEQIAASYGVRIQRRAWDNNFANARNASLQLSSGQWSLVLDADEVLNPGAAHLLRQVVQQTPPSYVTFPIFNYMADGESEGGLGYIMRLMPRRNDLHYTGKIHEQIAGPNLPHQNVSFTIYHYGYLEELTGVKLARNESYLLEGWKESPDDPRMAWYIAGTKAWQNQPLEALNILEQVPPGISPWHAMARHLQATLLVNLKRHEEALPLIEELEKRWQLPPLPSLRGQILCDQRRFDEALAAYQVAMETRVDPRLREHFPFFRKDFVAECYTGMANAALGQNDPARAEAFLAAALQSSASSAVARVAMATILTDAGRFHEALDHLEQARPRANILGQQRITLYSARIHVSLGQPDEAEQVLTHTTALPDDAQLLPIKAEIAELRSAWSEAARLWSEALDITPDVSALAHRAICYIKAGNITAAQADMEVVLADGEASHPYAYVAMAALAEATLNYKEALDYLYQAYDAGLTDVPVLLFLSRIALLAGSRGNAHRAAAAVLEVSPNLPEARRIFELTIPS